MRILPNLTPSSDETTSITMTADSNAPGSKVKSPSKLAHVVLRTAKFHDMVEFYKTVLGAKATFESDHIAFLTYDEEHHRVAIAGLPNTGPKVPTSSGLEHFAFTFDSLEDLALAYQQRKAKGILPFWSINHGPTTSIYYRDPDGNQIETQVDNFDTPEEADAFMRSKEFAENPVGTDFDPEDLVRQLQAGEDENVIKKRIEIGVRGMPAHLQG
jgi:catechol-2,3-dioxygenase